MHYEQELYHHGIKGQKWGVRRFQNPDGTLTAAGKRRNVVEARKNLNAEKKKLDDLNKKKSQIELDTTYNNDKIHDLYVSARDQWDYKKDRWLTDDEIDARWNKYSKVYEKALSENREYQEVLKGIKSQKATVKQLESLANTKTGHDYLNESLKGLGAMSATMAGVILVEYLMYRK